MRNADNLHSQLVGLVKIILPLAALALLSTMFLFARSSSEQNPIPLADLTERAREQGVSAPAFSGVTGDGSVLEIGAEVAAPDAEAPGEFIIERPRLSLDAADGTTLTVRAGEGRVDTVGQTANLSGLARLETSSGFVMETGGLTADLETGRITSHGQLAVQAPFGELTAGQVGILWSETAQGQQITFSDGVKLVYQPRDP